MDIVALLLMKNWQFWKSIQTTKLKTVVLQDGTNSILKRKTSEVAEHFDKYIELVKNVQWKFQPEYLVPCEVLCEVL